MFSVSPSLPTELLHTIFTYAKTCDHDMQVLFRLTWTSKAMRAVAQPILLQMFISLQMPDSSHRRDLPKEENPESLLILFRDIWPSHANIVVSVTVSLGNTQDCVAVNHLLVLLPLLQSLELSIGFDGDNRWETAMGLLTDQVRETVFPRLRSLSLEQIWWIPFTVFVIQFPSVRTLVINRCTLDEDDDDLDRNSDSDDGQGPLPGLPRVVVPSNDQQPSHPLTNLIIPDLRFQRDWHGVQRCVDAILDNPAMKVDIQSFVVRHDDEFPVPRRFPPSRVAFPTMIPLLSRFTATLRELNLGSFVFRHSLSHLANPNSSNFLTNFSLASFPHLKRFETTVLLKQKTARLELAGLFFAWLARQLRNQISIGSFENVLIHIRDQSIRQQVPPHWDWNGLQEDIGLENTWPGLDDALVMCWQNDAKLKVAWRVQGPYFYKPTRESRDIWMERIVEGLKHGLNRAYERGLLDVITV